MNNHGDSEKRLKINSWALFVFCIALLLPVLSFGCDTLSDFHSGKEILVTSIEDSGDGTLRWALEEANPGDVIGFDTEIFPPHAPATIYLSQELPPIDQGNLTLDASNAGVILDGSNEGSSLMVGLVVHSGNNLIMGLHIVNFKHGVGIILGGEAQKNIVGGNRNIGVGPIGQGNLLSGNDTGILLAGERVFGNEITGNFIGTDSSGYNPYVNEVAIDGVGIRDGASNNYIGPNNIIAFNSQVGVLVNGKATENNTITKNSIHSNGQGILLQEGGNVLIAAPPIIDFNLNEGLVEGLAEANGLVEVFSDNGREGKIFEGKTKADGSGWFSFSAGRELNGPSLTATVTDSKGNTSAFSEPTPTHGSGTGCVIQDGNDTMKSPLATYLSSELVDNRIGNVIFVRDEFIYEPGLSDYHSEKGIKWMRIGMDHAEFPRVVWAARQESTKLESRHISTIEDFNEAGIKVICGLIFWDIDAGGKEMQTPGYSRFRDGGEVDRYQKFVRETVRKLRGKIEYYELLNEPNPPHDLYVYPYDNYLDNNLRFGNQQFVRLDDYVSLIEKVVPVIREEDPEAKIAVGAVCEMQPAGPFVSSGQDYCFGLLESRVMPLVDAFTFHPLYNVTPQNAEIQHYAVNVDYEPPHPEEVQAYYDEYPNLLRKMRATAAENGFRGVFIADEIVYWSNHTGFPVHCPAPPLIFPEVQATKYYLRSTILHHGVDMKVILSYADNAMKNLSTVMAGHKAVNIPIKLEIDYDGPVAYCSFRYPNGDRMLAIWIDDVAVDEDPGVPATITFPGLTTDKVIGIDVLHGLEQELIYETDGGGIVIKNFLVKDYPVFVRLKSPTMFSGYLETIGDGFYRLER